MNHGHTPVERSARYKRNAMIVVVVIVGVAALQFAAGLQTSADQAAAPSSFTVGGALYQGNASCTGSKCHSADEPVEQSGQMIGDESNIWADSDPHSHAYESLDNPLSAEMAAKLKLDSTATSSRCLDCHAINAPKPQRGEGFSLADAVGCESCHGPAEKHLNPHADAGWTAKQRKALGSSGLLKQLALLDTADLSVRATGCVKCHLQIDKDMIDAGHPPLEFELHAYNYYVSKKPDTRFTTHWDEPVGKMIDARLWIAGQLAGKEAAAAQQRTWKARGWGGDDAGFLSKIYDKGAALAAKHFAVNSLKDVAGAKITAASAAAAAKDLARLAGEIDKTAPQMFAPASRRILAMGVTALGSAVFDADAAGDGPPDAFWEAYDTANSASGEAYVAAVTKMADLAADAAK